MSDAEMTEFPFDPDQDPEQKRNIRQSYRTLTSKIEEFQANPTAIATDDLREQVEAADKLFEKVKGTSEATLDSHLLLMASNMGAQKARALKAGTGSFDIEDYITKLVNFMSGGTKAENLPDGDDDEESEYNVEPSSKFSWDRVGRLVAAKSKRAPVLSFMLGPLSIEQKTRAVGKRVRFGKSDAPAQKPEELKQDDVQQSTNETTKNVNVLRAILDQSNETRINLFRFVINPDDFAQSVENIFYLSFLIRDGIVALEIEDGEPLIFMCEKPTDAEYEQGLQKQQLVLEFDEATWRYAIEVFQIKESMIPQRPKERDSRSGSKWYG